MTIDLHHLTGAYALDALDSDERQAFELHLSECPDCADEVGGLQATAAQLGVAAATGVPPAFHDAVLAEVRRTRQLPPVAIPRGQDRNQHGRNHQQGRVLPMVRPRQRGPRTWLAVAAAMVVLGGTLGGVAVQQHRQVTQAQQVAAAMSAVLAAPDARQINADGVARVILSLSEGKAVFVGQKLPPVAPDHVLQLWVMDGSTRSVGVIRGSTALLATGLRSGSQLGVTVEPSGGSDQPTTEPVMTMPLA